MKDSKKNVTSNEVTDRRSLLKGIIAGSAVVTGSKALPETWVKPISDAVVLPGHAQTTTDYGDGRGGGDYEYTRDDDAGSDYSYTGDFEGNSNDFGDDYATDGDYEPRPTPIPG